MTTVYLIRHAEAEGNLFKRIHGQYDSPVTALGRRQIACLERRFAGVPVDAVYASDLKRTCQTAGAVSLPKGLPLHREPLLREISLGVWEDEPFGSVMQTDMEEMIRFCTGDPAWRVEGGESLRQVGDRMEAALGRIIAENPGRTVAVFSHGTAIRQLLTRLLHRPETPEGYLSEGCNTAVSCLEADGAGVRVLWYNDASHLTEDILAASVKPGQGREHMEAGRLLPELLWFRPWDGETEGERYLSYRSEHWLSCHGTPEGFDGPAFLAAARRRSRFDPGAVQTVMSGEEPAGVLELDYEPGKDEGAGVISFYYLAPKYRGRGLGVQLLGQAVSAYRGMGRARLRLDCPPENEAARRFFRRWGFDTADPTVPQTLMERAL